MNVYAESSAVLAWLIGEPAGDRTRQVLGDATRIVTSSLTVLECSRSLARAADTGRLSPTEELAAIHLLETAGAGWHVHDVSDDVLERARQRFPIEPIRSLDALHLATASIFRRALGDLAVLSLDERIRANAPPLGLTLLP